MSPFAELLRSSVEIGRHHMLNSTLLARCISAAGQYYGSSVTYCNKCKKHSLSHQLTAQLHIENSKNKKNGDNTIAAYRLNAAKVYHHFFIFAVFDV